MELIHYLLIGIFSGFFAGLFGIGGGLLVVPMLANVFPMIGFTDNIMQFATGTSLAVMVFNAASSTYTHHHRQAVSWERVKYLAPGGIVGSILGRQAAHLSPSVFLATIFVIVVYVIAIGIIIESRQRNNHKKLENDSNSIIMIMIVGVIVGFTSGMLGIGGGILIVPYLIRCGLSMVRAIGTAAACGLLFSAVGTTGAIIFGPEVDIPYCFGYVSLPAAACIAITGIPAATFGARLTHNVSDSRLKVVFAMFLMLVATSTLWQFV